MNFIIGAQAYTHNSGGVRALYELACRLVRRGQTVTINHPWYIPSDRAERDIVVYPESISGNPSGADKVVRYILNVPGRMGGDLTYHKDELLVAYHKTFAQYAGGHILYIPIIEDFFHVDPTIPRTGDAVWVGKGVNTHNHPAGCFEMTKECPATRRGVAMLMKSARTFYTYDNVTCVIEEALRCGCRVVYLVGDPAGGEIITRQDNPSEEEAEEQMTEFLRRCAEKWG